MKHLVRSACCVAVLTAGPQAQARVTAQIVAWGEVTAKQLGEAAPEFQGHGLSPAGTITDMTYVNHATTVEAQLCRMYGFTARFTADPGDTLPEVIDVRIRHPRFTRPDGATSTEEDGPTEVTGDRAEGSFSFDHPWELQPGDWSVELILDGAVLASQAFTVTEPLPGAPALPCDGAPQV